jgi:two-component system, LytTR family, response regulator
VSVAIRVAIVDDERLARERLKRLAGRVPDLEVTQVCHDGESAVEAITQDPPDVVFLDVQIPGGDGFAVARALRERLQPGEMPLVVFVTAYDAHALRAFEAQALDYLVKPFDDDRFLEMLTRVRQRVRERRLGAATEQLRSLLGADPGAVTAPPALGPDTGRLDRIVVRAGERTRLIPAETVDWVEADGVYARIHAAKEQFLIRVPMHEMEARLDPRRFVRIHRSTIVNLDRVAELRELWRGEYAVVLHDGTRLKLSRSRKSQLEALLGQSL